MKIPLYIEARDDNNDECSFSCPFYVHGGYCALFAQELEPVSTDQHGNEIYERYTECRGLESYQN